MPVINLPTDQRWGQLGTGLGALLGQVVQARQVQQVAQGVGQIQQDPNIPDDQKSAEVLKRYGEPGWNIYTNLIKSQVLQGQLKLQGSEMQKNAAQTNLYGAEAQAYPAKTAADVAKQKAETGLAEAKTALAPGENVKNVQEAGKAASEGNLADVKTKMAERQLAASAPDAGGGPNLDTVLSPFGLTPSQVAAAKTVFQGAEAQKLGSGLEKATQYAANIQRNSSTPMEIAKVAAATSQSASNANKFIDSFNRDPKTGLAKGATIKAWLEGKGFSTGDAELLTQSDTGLLNAAANATSGGGFWSTGRFNLARDTTATIQDSPLRAVINLDITADSKIKELQSYKLSQPGRQLKDVDAALQGWQDVKAKTSAYNTYRTADGDKTIVIHGGDELDVSSFKPLIIGSKQYKVGSYTIDGATIVARAQAKGLDPQVYLAQAQAYFGTGAAK